MDSTVWNTSFKVQVFRNVTLCRWVSILDISKLYLCAAVGITTRYGLDGPESNPIGGEIFRTRPDRPWGPPSLLYNGYRVFPGCKVTGAWR